MRSNKQVTAPARAVSIATLSALQEIDSENVALVIDECQLTGRGQDGAPP